MTDRPSRVTRLTSRLKGEVPADFLRAYRSAGNHVQALHDELATDSLRQRVDGLDAWTRPPGAQIAALGGWHLEILQLVADVLVDADEQLSPSTVGFVPPELAQQAHSMYLEVADWLRIATVARQDPNPQIRRALPASLPWLDVVHVTEHYARCQLFVADAVSRRISVAVSSFRLDSDGQPDRQHAVARVNSALAEAEESYAYLRRLYPESGPIDMPTSAANKARIAINSLHGAGQLLAIPSLALGTMPWALPDTGPHDTDVREQLVDTAPDVWGPWAFTDHDVRTSYQMDAGAQSELDSHWSTDLDSAGTLRLWKLLQESILNGAVVRCDAGRSPSMHYQQCPWAPMYEARQPLFVHGRLIGPFQQFTVAWEADAARHGSLLQLVHGQFDNVVLAQDDWVPTDAPSGSH